MLSCEKNYIIRVIIRTKDSENGFVLKLHSIRVPGQYFIAGIISIGIGKSMLEFTKWGIVLILFGIICFALEIISPIIAGMELYEKTVKNIKKIFR